MTTVRITNRIFDIYKSEAVHVVLGTLILCAGAQISIPLQPVPIVLTTVSVMLLGLLYSKRSALSSVALYIVLGACGIPVFQGFSGGARILYGPTAGYILGFVAALWVMTSIKERYSVTSFRAIFLTCILGTFAIFIPGVLWLSVLLGFKKAFLLGVVPFIVPGIVKSLLLSGAIRFVGICKSV